MKQDDLQVGDEDFDSHSSFGVDAARAFDDERGARWGLFKFWPTTVATREPILMLLSQFSPF
jgi:hypothetical protein